MNRDMSNTQSLKYQRFTPSGLNDKWIRKSEFVINIKLKDQGKTTKEGEKGKDGGNRRTEDESAEKGKLCGGGGGRLKLDCETRVEI